MVFSPLLLRFLAILCALSRASSDTVGPLSPFLLGENVGRSPAGNGPGRPSFSPLTPFSTPQSLPPPQFGGRGPLPFSPTNHFNAEKQGARTAFSIPSAKKEEGRNANDGRGTEEWRSANLRRVMEQERAVNGRMMGEGGRSGTGKLIGQEHMGRMPSGGNGKSGNRSELARVTGQAVMTNTNKSSSLTSDGPPIGPFPRPPKSPFVETPQKGRAELLIEKGQKMDLERVKKDGGIGEERKRGDGEEGERRVEEERDWGSKMGAEDAQKVPLAERFTPMSSRRESEEHKAATVENEERARGEKDGTKSGEGKGSERRELERRRGSGELEWEKERVREREGNAWVRSGEERGTNAWEEEEDNRQLEKNGENDQRKGGKRQLEKNRENDQREGGKRQLEKNRENDQREGGKRQLEKSREYGQSEREETNARAKETRQQWGKDKTERPTSAEVVVGSLLFSPLQGPFPSGPFGKKPNGKEENRRKERKERTEEREESAAEREEDRKKAVRGEIGHAGKARGQRSRKGPSTSAPTPNGRVPPPHYPNSRTASWSSSVEERDSRESAANDRPYLRAVQQHRQQQPPPAVAASAAHSRASAADVTLGFQRPIPNPNEFFPENIRAAFPPFSKPFRELEEKQAKGNGGEERMRGTERK